jgi:hypothetical protein
MGVFLGVLETDIIEMDVGLSNVDHRSVVFTSLVHLILSRVCSGYFLGRIIPCGANDRRPAVTVGDNHSNSLSDRCLGYFIEGSDH